MLTYAVIQPYTVTVKVVCKLDIPLTKANVVAKVFLHKFVFDSRLPTSAVAHNYVPMA